MGGSATTTLCAFERIAVTLDNGRATVDNSLMMTEVTTDTRHGNELWSQQAQILEKLSPGTPAIGASGLAAPSPVVKVRTIAVPDE